MKLETLVTLLVVAIVLWQLFGDRLGAFKARVARILRVAAISYMAIIAVRLVTSPVDREQLQTLGLSLAFFGGVWAVAWLVTRSVASRSK